jgi:tetratricopeptide (TPR) repeat protein
LAVAAHRALRRYAAAQAAGIAQHGLDLLESLPERAALRDTEIELNVELGLSMTILHGVTSAESTTAFGHAAELMDEMHPAPARVAALHGIWMTMLARAKYVRARDMAVQALALAAQRDDSHLAFAGHTAMGITLAHTGDSAHAQDHLAQALQLQRTVGAVLPDAMFSFHPGVQLRCYSALMLWNLGQPSAATQQVQQAVELADSLRHPITWILSRFVQGLFHCMFGEHEKARLLTQRALEDASEQRLDRSAGALWWVNGRAAAALGDTDTGLQLMRKGHELKQRHGQRYGLTRWYEHYAEACMAAGRDDEAMATLDEGLQLADSNGEHLSTASMHCLRGHLLRDAGHRASADAAYRTAQTAAREQGALYLEIGAAVARHALFVQTEGTVARCESVADLEALLEHWSDPMNPPHVVQAKAWIQRAVEQR